MLRVGLTGGIACGKSLVLEEFRKLGVFGLDADQMARGVVRPGQPAYLEIARHFGNSILQQDGAIDRKKLGQVVFADEGSRETLNHIIHPYILAEEERRIAVWKESLRGAPVPIVMVDAALMVETGSYRRYDVLIAVYCRPRIQLNRLTTREGFSRKAALQRIRSQMSAWQKTKYADYVIDNSGTPPQTRAQVRQIFPELLDLSEKGGAKDQGTDKPIQG